ncbi:putative amidohydrolase [Promicromonospora sp. AC04]|uniref:carbon-nitrogen hydrolase family protein n=1 Tax=Promicromonospora sp. AC04 TaxID=2135723 RepID=UPI000D3B1664|nr:carbon-nitrogen hydrolase family protein [Promicromonospora sp. AC04]PUB24843.1 putative amidohydrolase [Promicromonospora sp. AC04]
MAHQPIKVASAAIEVQWDPAANLAQFEVRMREAADQGVDLLVLPEQALQGYLPDTLSLDLDHVGYQQEHAEPLDGPSVRRIVALASELGLHVIFGMTERDTRSSHVLYNTAVLLGPSGLVGSYRKVHQPGDEKHVYWPGDEFPVFDTELGRIGMLICYDKCFPETTRALALRGAQILVMPTAWAYQDAACDPATDPMVDYYTLFGRVRALENQCWFIGANLVGPLGRLRYHGHSRVIDPLGRIVADTGPQAGLAIAEIDVAGAIARARSRDYIAYDFLKDYIPIDAGGAISRSVVPTSALEGRWTA